MKFSTLYYSIILTLATIIFTYLGYWWCIPIVAFCISMYSEFKVSKLALLSFAIPFFIWLFWSMYQDLSVESAPSGVVAKIFGSLPAYALYIVSGLIPGLTCLFASLAGKGFKR